MFMIDYRNLEPGDTLPVHIGSNVRPMDNHRWALLV